VDLLLLSKGRHPREEMNVGIWTEILNEVNRTKDITEGPSALDQVRRKYLKQLADLTGRPIVTYATAFLDAGTKGRGDVSIHPGDKEGFLEVTRDLPEGPLDVILHSPGGTAEGAETIVQLLRSKFDHVRFIIPIAAKSAATMLALSGNQLVGGVTSELGPIDPQFRMSRPDRGPFSAPALAIKKQFAMADDAVTKDKSKLPLWVPLISQFGPSLLAECDQALDLSTSLVREWLRTYMFAGREDAEERADAIANDLSDWDKYKSHGRAVRLEEMERLGAEVVWMDRDPAMNEAVWYAWHAISITLSNTGTVKLFENHEGTCQVMSMEVRVVPEERQSGKPSGGQQMNREQRRAAAKKRR
jgi:hypothetical protein